MLFGMLPVTALAADPVYVAWIGETGYETLGEAVKAAKEAEIVVLAGGEDRLQRKFWPHSHPALHR